MPLHDDLVRYDITLTQQEMNTLKRTLSEGLPSDEDEDFEIVKWKIYGTRSYLIAHPTSGLSKRELRKCNRRHGWALYDRATAYGGGKGCRACENGGEDAYMAKLRNAEDVYKAQRAPL